MAKASTNKAQKERAAARKPAAKRAASRPAAKRGGRTAAKASGRPATGARAAAKTAAATKRTAKKPAASKNRRAAGRATSARRGSAGAKASGRARSLVAATRTNLTAAASEVARAVESAVASLTERVSRGNGTPDALEMLEQDHRRLEALLKQGGETSARAAKTRTELLDTITAELAVHELIEEQVLYPALKAHPKARDIVLEGYQEHHVADLIVKELHGLARSDERWGAKFKVLKENIEHHIEEEEGKMFATARSIFSREEREALGNEMRRLKARSA